MALTRAFVLLAERLQTASEAMSSGEIRGKLSKAVDAAHSGTGRWADYLDHTGDEESGDVRFMHGDQMKMAPYSKGTESSDSDYSVDTSKSKVVQPVTNYVEVPDEADCYAAMEAAGLYTKGDVPTVERFVGKKERDAAGSGDFAGKGKSFPILKKEDVRAAISSIGRAGTGNYSADVIRKNIKRIATAKGWDSELPDSWKGDASAEEAARQAAGTVTLVECAGFPQTFEFREASALNPLVKVISPGRGSSGYYTADVLKKAAETKVFGRGTLMYFNHATAAEEAQRPEGDYNRLAAVTTGDAYWDDNGKDGAALYAPAKVFAKHAQEVAEKAPHTGVSIRASGKRDDKAMGPDGKPGVITELTHAESIDLVTKAGRDGKLLLESAGDQLTEGDAMSATELQKLQEVNRGIAKRLAATEARGVAAATLKDLRFSADVKESIIARALTNVPITESCDFDAEGFKKVLEAEITYAASLIPGGVKVVGVGATAADPKVAEAARERDRKDRELVMRRSARAMGIRTEEGMRIFLEGRGAFDPSFNSADERLAVGTEA